MHGNAPLSPFTGVPGWLTDDEEALLMRYAGAVGKDGQVVGIGVEYGRSTAAFLKASKAAIFGVELAPKAEYELNIVEASFSVDDANILVGDSKQVGKAWSFGAIDFLFIDGDHSYEGCLGDIQAWVDHVRPGGFMAFHDVAQPTNKLPHYLHFEVERAIQEWFQFATLENWRLVETVDTIAVFQLQGTPFKLTRRDPEPGVINLHAENAPPVAQPPSVKAAPQRPPARKAVTAKGGKK